LTTYASATVTGGEVFSQDVAATSSSLTSSSTIPTEAIVTPVGTTSKYAGGGEHILSGTSKPPSSGGQKKNVEWRFGLVAVIVLLGNLVCALKEK
jgi:hypothetical protein